MTGRSPRPHRKRATRPLTLTPSLPEPEQQTVPVTGPPPVVGSLCTGYGGLDLGVLAALGGGQIAWVADPDPHITQILHARAPGIPNLGDLRHIDWTSVEPVDVVTVGFPCQDISAAGKRAGIEKGVRSGLWVDIVAGVRVLRPPLLVVENVAALRWKGGGLHRVLGDLAEAGYDALWRSVRAADIGAPHRRERVFLLAWPREPAPCQRERDSAACFVDGDRARRLLQWRQRHQQTGRLDPAGPVAVVADADRLRREELHAPDPAGRPLVARPGTPATDATRLGHRHSRPQGGRGVPATAVPAGVPDDRSHGVAADATSDRRDERLPSAAGFQRRSDAALGDHPGTHPTGASAGRRPRDRDHLVAVPHRDTKPVAVTKSEPAAVNWGVYETAIRRWEQLLGRPAPYPTRPGNHGRPVLAPTFVEHLMGLTAGWVTDLPLPRTAQLRALGNGVVPQQAAHAVACLLDDLAELLHRNTEPRSPGRQEMTAA